MQWAEVCADPNLRSLPYKIELNEWGQIVMSPVKVYHSIFQSEMVRWFYELAPHGKVASECAIWTKKGTKVADVAWMSLAIYEKVKWEDECSLAPEICVEVLSTSNTGEEMLEKKALYFEQGAHEVWICYKNGKMHFYSSAQPLKQSQLIPDFPKKLNL